MNKNENQPECLGAAYDIDLADGCEKCRTCNYQTKCERIYEQSLSNF